MEILVHFDRHARQHFVRRSPARWKPRTSVRGSGPFRPAEVATTHGGFSPGPPFAKSRYRRNLQLSSPYSITGDQSGPAIPYKLRIATRCHKPRTLGIGFTARLIHRNVFTAALLPPCKLSTSRAAISSQFRL